MYKTTEECVIMILEKFKKDCRYRNKFIFNISLIKSVFVVEEPVSLLPGFLQCVWSLLKRMELQTRMFSEILL